MNLKKDADTWLRNHAETLMRRLGLRSGHTVVDFGCRDGRYAVPAARVVGPEGRVWALDKERKALAELKRRVRNERLTNIHPRLVTDGPALPALRAAVDVVLLFDVLHGAYFPEAHLRRNLLAQVYHLLKPGGLLVCYLTHVRQFGLSYPVLLGEIRDAGFRLRDESRRTLVHDDSVVRGRVFRFTKARPPRRSPGGAAGTGARDGAGRVRRTF